MYASPGDSRFNQGIHKYFTAKPSGKLQVSTGDIRKNVFIGNYFYCALDRVFQEHYHSDVVNGGS